MTFYEKMYKHKPVERKSFAVSSVKPMNPGILEQRNPEKNYQYTRKLEKDLEGSKKRVENLESTVRRLIQEQRKSRVEMEQIARTLGR